MAKTRTTILTQGVGGRVGRLQFVPSPYGTVWKEMPGPRLRFSEGEAAQQDRVRRIGAAWRALGPGEVALWRAWDEASLALVPPLQRRPVAAYNAFLAVATRLLMMDPQATLPRLPPAAAFGGDAVAVVAEAFSGSPSFACERGEGPPSETTQDSDGKSPPASSRRWKRGESDHSELSTPQTPPLTEVKGGGDGILFRASRANAPGVATELMAQRLLSGGRTPRPQAYASQGFVAFAEGSLEAGVPCSPGWYALAYRFVDARTGQATAIFPCGIVSVGV